MPYSFRDALLVYKRLFLCFELLISESRDRCLQEVEGWLHERSHFQTLAETAFLSSSFHRNERLIPAVLSPENAEMTTSFLCKDVLTSDLRIFQCSTHDFIILQILFLISQISSATSKAKGTRILLS